MSKARESCIRIVSGSILAYFRGDATTKGDKIALEPDREVLKAKPGGRLICEGKRGYHRLAFREMAGESSSYHLWADYLAHCRPNNYSRNLLRRRHEGGMMSIQELPNLLKGIVPDDHSRQVVSTYYVDYLVARHEIQRVMDLGCGKGDSEEMFHRKAQGIEWTGLDIQASSDREILTYDGIQAGTGNTYCDHWPARTSPRP